MVQYLSQVLPPLSPAAAAAAAAAAANSASVPSSSAAAAAAASTAAAAAAGPAAMDVVPPVNAPRPRDGHSGDTPAAQAARGDAATAGARSNNAQQ
ncbi:hypothetical protein DUNSADRAFT_7090 [Dunaliella salina]|uniref:Encoded protein n=1 Tax=Dunaliella salina TaxID=3046 RepID=A0ABQ7H6I7_DUNSA|nr:hypothetical protein DUNSADRAFT_7090 [Dunaliella salina]|eukprot:KAF5842480.1 hypothetical protein DUNSADRAFT_7090 [Dunaliella salina]